MPKTLFSRICSDRADSGESPLHSETDSAECAACDMHRRHAQGRRHMVVQKQLVAASRMVTPIKWPSMKTRAM